MGYTKLAIYLAGLVLVVLAAWVFLTQTAVGSVVPGGIALAIILLLIGIGVMASARSINDARYSRRVTRDEIGATGGLARERVVERPATSTVVERRVVDEPAASDTFVEERRWD